MTSLRTKGTAILIAAFAAMILKPALAARWGPMNTGFPSTGLSVNSLVIDPASSFTLFALTTTQSTVGGPGATVVPLLFKSTDAAANWTAIGTVSGVTCLAIDPSNSSNLYAGTNQGVVKSTDGGLSWIDISNKLPVASVTHLLIDPLKPSTLYAVVINTPSAPGGTIATSLYKTIDGGANWGVLNTGLSPSAYITAIVLAPSDSSTIYILAPAFNPSMPNGLLQVGGLVRSSDAGQTWTPVNGQFLSTVLPLSLAVDSTVPNTLYLGDNQGLQKSTDGGQTWNSLNPGLPPNGSVEFVASAASAIFVTVRTFSPNGQVDNLLKSTDGGTTWNSLNIASPVSSSITSVAPDPKDSTRVYASVSGFARGAPFSAAPAISNGAVFKTVDGGQTWSSSATGLAAFDVRAVAINLADENAVYAGGSGGVFSSVDGGATWNITGLAAYTTLLMADPNAPGSLYALTGSSNGCNSSDALLFATTDAGANWSSAVSPLNSGCILNGTFSGVNTPPFAISPADSNRLYLAESDTMDGFSAILKTTDRAADWTILWDWFNGLSTPVRALASDPSQPDTVYAGMDDGTTSGGLFKSTDGGLTWTNNGMTTSAVSLLAVDPGNPQIIYAATEGHHTIPVGFQGLFKSTDGGQTWLAINTGLSALLGIRSTTATALVIDPSDTQALYLGTSTSGVYRSADGGATWNAFNDGLTSLPVRSLAVDQSHSVYAVTSNGVFKFADMPLAPAMLSRTAR